MRHMVALAALAWTWLGLCGVSWGAMDWMDQNKKQVKALLESSPHGSMDCADCHSGTERPAPAPPEVDCSACHSDAQDLYAKSVHGAAAATGDTQAARCFDCHGSHDIRTKKDPLSKVYPFNIPMTCGQCHGDKNNNGIDRPNAKKTGAKFLDSIHGRVLTKSGLLIAAQCVSCHGSHSILPKSDAGSKTHQRNVAATCGSCHAGILSHFQESIHGVKLADGDTRVPTCNTCHTAHEITEGGRKEFQLGAVNECGSCHAESLHTYRDNFHGKVTALGFAFTAKCADCHTPHDIQPASDTRSSVHPDRRVETCGQCHPSANANFVQFDPHAKYSDRKRNPVLYWSYIGMNTLLISTFVFFGIHTLLWFVREMAETRRERKNGHG